MGKGGGGMNEENEENGEYPPVSCSACASEKARADQLGVNCRWLIDRLDRVCHALAPGYVGSWQDRANKAVEAAEAMTQNDKVEFSERSEASER